MKRPILTDDEARAITRQLRTNALTAIPVTKSAIDALRCPRFYQQSRSDQRMNVNGARVGGISFHSYRAEYGRHLRDSRQTRDIEWLRAFIGSHPFDPDTLELIRVDSTEYSIDLDGENYFEQYLSLATTGGALRCFEVEATEQLPRDPHALSVTVLDHVFVRGVDAAVTDIKTGWVAKPDLFEIKLAAASVMIHFPEVQTVEFEYDVPRSRSAADAPMSFIRCDVPFLVEEIRAQHARLHAIRQRIAANEDLPYDTTSGLCGRCAYRCPARDVFAAGLGDLPPLQTDDDAREVAKLLIGADSFRSQASARLKDYFLSSGRAFVEVANGRGAYLKPSITSEFPLDAALRALGLTIPDVSPLYQVPLSSLTVGSTGLKDKARAKMRAGLMQKLEQIAKRTPKITVEAGAIPEDLKR